MQELSGHFHNFVRMPTTDFEVLITKVGHIIGKKDTNFRNAYPVKKRFHNFVRMPTTDFEVLITKVGHIIGKKDTNFRNAYPVKKRLALTLRFLATGDSYASMQYLFKISKQVICAIVPEVCLAIIQVCAIVPEVCLAIIQVLRNYVKVRINNF
ncbi:hypothetical protein QE152_g27797 [Popillia japonica]|uniref:Uncharacterized protein n=1 Tax=Popillia japonica TaxID=7064 RepID=A0AAW1JLX8_POPJA